MAEDRGVATMGMMFVPALLAILCAAPDTFQREEMVRTQIIARGVRDQAVLRAIRSTPRHLFVPPAVRIRAYEDSPLPIGHGQTISQPYIVALMSELLDVKPTHRVLEIGTGSGYQAAVLGALAGRVFTIEIVPELAASAKKLLQARPNITVRQGNGYLGWPEEAPFDRIMLTAAPPKIPQTLIDQLKPGGKLVAPEGRGGFEQQLIVIDKQPNGKLKRRAVLPVRFVPMVDKHRFD